MAFGAMWVEARKMNVSLALLQSFKPYIAGITNPSCRLWRSVLQRLLGVFDHSRWRGKDLFCERL